VRFEDDAASAAALPVALKEARAHGALGARAALSHPSYQRFEFLKRAWALPVATMYAPLLPQSFTSICGPTSAANVLRSIQIPSGGNPFRKFGVRAMSLGQLALESASIVPPQWRVDALRPAGLDDFRAQLRLTNDVNYRYIANFSRRWLFGHGGGHHSPIGGYLESEDLAFVLDVNAGYGPWLVPTDRLFQAVNEGDWAGITRGLVRLNAGNSKNRVRGVRTSAISRHELLHDPAGEARCN